MPINTFPPASTGGGGTTTNALTFNNGGTGAASGASFDGSAAKTISFNTLGAYADTNPSGYITSSALSPYLTSATAASTYQPIGTYLTNASIGSTVQAYSANLTSWAALTTSAKQDALVSGTNIKTVNSNSLLGSGNVSVGTVTSVDFSGGTTGLSTTGGPITGTGTLTLTGTLAVANGGTGQTSGPAAVTALEGYTTTATAGGTTTLTATSTLQQYFTGTTTQTVQLPVTSTLALGWSYYITNNSTGNLTVNSSGGNLVCTIIPGTAAMITCILTSGTTAASWDFGFNDFASVTGTGGVALATNPTITNPVLASTTYMQQGTQTSKSAAATLTIAELLTGIIQYTGAAANLTLPTGTNIEGGVVSGLAVDRAFEFIVINTGTGAATLVTAAGLTLTGAMAVTNGTSARFRVRKTAANAYTVYRV